MLHTGKIHLIGALAATFVLVVLVGCGSGESSSPPAAEASGEESMRTVLVFDSESAVPSPSEETSLHAGLEEGQLPPGGPVEATVLTDEDCAPDAQGVSHCRNEVRLDNGQTLVLRHVHAMAEVPCLAPEEKVLLRSSSQTS